MADAVTIKGRFWKTHVQLPYVRLNYVKLFQTAYIKGTSFKKKVNTGTTTIQILYFRR